MVRALFIETENGIECKTYDIDYWAKQVSPENKFVIIETEDCPDLPRAREFREAWILKGKKLDWDLVKAHNTALKLINEALEPLLKALDAPFMKAMENFIMDGDNAQALEIKAKKNQIRALKNPLVNLEPRTIGDVLDCLSEARQFIKDFEV